ncbi:fatty acid synthase alpha subunit Lsd1, partial [Spiromyces aspiralis]
MVATNPARVGKGFGEEALKYVVDSIRHHAKGLLEIVNYNVENWQYVVSGELRLLSVLSDVLSYLNMQKIDLSKLIQEMPIEKVQEKLAAIISECAEKADKIIARDGFINLERGKATIPLPGIDVPFHSSFLLPGVGPFRNFLLRKMNITDIDLSRLRHLYIPNLTAKPFDITREYFEEVYDLTQSSRVAKVLREWDDEWLSSPGEQQRLAYTLLVELLAYQFASPVRWIETQDQLFKRYNIERFIEIGPAPTLINMAARTLKFKYEAYDDAMTRRRTNLCYIKDEKELYYAYDPEPEPTGEGSAGQESSSSSDAAAPAVAAAVAAPVPAATPAATAASAEIPDTPVSAKEILHAVVAQKLKKSLDEVPISKSIRDLVGGKSTLQNEILGDLQKEFGNAVPEKSEETPLDELAESIAGFSGQLGKFTSNQVSRLISGKMPGGFSLVTAKAHLKKAYGLGPARADGLLLVGLTMEPASRLGSEDDAKAWLDKVAQEYAKRAGITYSAATAGAAGGAAGGAVAAVINSAEFEEAQRKQVSLVRSQLAALAKYLDLDLRAGDRAFEAKKIESDMLQAELDLWMAEHGEAYANGIKPSFEPLKARHFDSYWNWSRQDALVLYYEILFGKTTEVDRQVTSRAIHLMNRANETLLRYMKYRLDNTDVTKGESYKRAHDLGLMLYENCREALSHSPVYKDVGYPTGPNTTITADGDIVYREVNREGERKLLDYVKKMSEGSHLTEFSNRQTIQQSLSKVYKMIKQQDKIKKAHKQAVKTMYAEILHSLSMSSKVLENTSQGGSKVARRRSVTSAFANDEAAANGLAKKTPAKERIPFLHLKHKLSTGDWEYSPKLTSMYLEVLTDICKNGLTFENKYVLITGCGKGSIGAEILCGVLAGGAKVIVTTSRYSREAIEYYQGIYQRYGAKGSSLIVVPFNQGSQQDVNALINYIYDTDPRNGLGWDLDFVIPFAAIPERGREISDLDSLSELSHRVMLTNLLRMLGEIKTQKQKRGYDTRPAQ